MLSKARPYSMPECHQNELRSLPPCKLHGGHKVAVRSDKNNELHLFLQREARNVQADPHVDPLLSDARLDVVGTDLDPWTLLLQYTPAKAPSFMQELTKSKGIE